MRPVKTTAIFVLVIGLLAGTSAGVAAQDDVADTAPGATAAISTVGEDFTAAPVVIAREVTDLYCEVRDEAGQVAVEVVGGQIASGSILASASVVVDSDTIEGVPCSTFNCWQVLSFDVGIAEEGGGATLSFTKGEVSGPGHSGNGCHPEDFGVGERVSVPASVRVTGAEGPDLYGEVVLEGEDLPILRFHVAAD